MKGKFKEFFKINEVGMANNPMTPATPNSPDDPDDRKKRQLATQAQQKLTQAKNVVNKPDASHSKKKQVLKDLQKTRDELRNVNMQDTIGDIEKQLQQISPNTMV
jgi:conjugal transfer/entry exclusion protein